MAATHAEDFTIQTPDEILESFNTILDIVQAVLIGIALISLFVGSVGIKVDTTSQSYAVSTDKENLVTDSTNGIYFDVDDNLIFEV